MRCIISGHGVAVTPAFRQMVERKVGKLPRILPKIIEAKVMLSAEKYRRTAHITLVAKRRIFSSEETAGDLAAAVDLAVDALTRQVRQVKDRLRQRKPRASRRRPGPRPEAGEPRLPGEGEAAPPLVVESRRVAAKPMSVEEAVMQLGLRDDQFLVFTNAATETVNVLYRRKNGGLGLIEPVA
ncbi:MAG: sigma 54 modulation protein/ribosomal protein S30EA, putative sigma-54 modulation protein [Candidatus Rokubacteria bacterium CSP1-6]|nr:MAG: sigma 54 modulation protein/ribosomal protein S30EA, putative sigma-54 modulation protein [Candidatus Rokubacteria bacterium CSP1-6]